MLIQSRISKGLEIKCQYCNEKTAEISILLSQNLSKSESDDFLGIEIDIQTKCSAYRI